MSKRLGIGVLVLLVILGSFTVSRADIIVLSETYSIDASNCGVSAPEVTTTPNIISCMPSGTTNYAMASGSAGPSSGSLSTGAVVSGGLIGTADGTIVVDFEDARPDVFSLTFGVGASGEAMATVELTDLTDGIVLIKATSSMGSEDVQEGGMIVLPTCPPAPQPCTNQFPGPFPFTLNPAKEYSLLVSSDVIGLDGAGAEASYGVPEPRALALLLIPSLVVLGIVRRMA